jgi:hypothetical protein
MDYGTNECAFLCTRKSPNRLKLRIWTSEILTAMLSNQPIVFHYRFHSFNTLFNDENAADRLTYNGSIPSTYDNLKTWKGRGGTFKDNVKHRKENIGGKSCMGNYSHSLTAIGLLTSKAAKPGRRLMMAVLQQDMPTNNSCEKSCQRVVKKYVTPCRFFAGLGIINNPIAFLKLS